MTKFYEIRLLTVCGFITLCICSFLSFWAGRIIPASIIFLPILLIIGLGFSIYYIKISIQNKKAHLLCFSVLIIGIFFAIGIVYDVQLRKHTENYLLNAAIIVEEYKKNKNIEILTEEDYKKIVLPKSIRIYKYGDNDYRLKYKNTEYYDNKIVNPPTWHLVF